MSLILDLGHKISVKSNDPRESKILWFQCLHLTLQRLNAIAEEFRSGRFELVVIPQKVFTLG